MGQGRSQWLIASQRVASCCSGKGKSSLPGDVPCVDAVAMHPQQGGPCHATLLHASDIQTEAPGGHNPPRPHRFLTHNNYVTRRWQRKHSYVERSSFCDKRRH